jgi:hypothetical protein
MRLSFPIRVFPFDFEMSRIWVLRSEFLGGFRSGGFIGLFSAVSTASATSSSTFIIISIPSRIDL